jgi:hypothetical protein
MEFFKFKKVAGTAYTDGKGVICKHVINSILKAIKKQVEDLGGKFPPIVVNTGEESDNSYQIWAPPGHVWRANKQQATWIRTRNTSYTAKERVEDLLDFENSVLGPGLMEGTGPLSIPENPKITPWKPVRDDLPGFDKSALERTLDQDYVSDYEKEVAEEMKKRGTLIYSEREGFFANILNNMPNSPANFYLHLSAVDPGPDLDEHFYDEIVYNFSNFLERDFNIFTSFSFGKFSRHTRIKVTPQSIKNIIDNFEHDDLSHTIKLEVYTR